MGIAHPNALAVAPAPPEESGDHGLAPTDADEEAERQSAIETLVALAAKIEAARADRTTFSASAQAAVDAPAEITPPAAIMPRFIYDPVEETAPTVGGEVEESARGPEGQAPPTELPAESSVQNISRWAEALKASYPEVGLLLAVVLLLAALVYAAAPGTEDAARGPVLAEIRADEAAVKSPAQEDARLKFVGTETCSGRPCGALLEYTPPPPKVVEASEADPRAAYATAAEPAATDVAPSAPAAAPAPEPEATAAAPATDSPAAIAAASNEAPPEHVGTEAPATAPMTTEAVTPYAAPAEPIAAEPAREIAAESPAAAPATIEAKPDSIADAPLSSASIEPSPSPAQSLPVEPRSVTTAKPATAAAPAAPRPAKAAVANRKAQQPAKKNTATAQVKVPGTKAASVKPLPKAVPAATASAASGNKAPGFPASTPAASLFKPAPAKPAPPPQATASKNPEPTAPAAGFAPADKPPGFEILNNLGGGFFAMQPY